MGTSRWVLVGCVAVCDPPKRLRGSTGGGAPTAPVGLQEHWDVLGGQACRDGGGTGAPPTWGGTLSFVCRPPPTAPHLAPAPGGWKLCVRGSGSGGGTNTQLGVRPPSSAHVKGLSPMSHPPPPPLLGLGTHCDELGRSQPIPWGWDPSGGRIQPSTPRLVPQLCCLAHLTSCFNSARLRIQGPLGWGEQAPYPQIPVLTPSLPQFPYLGSEKQLENWTRGWKKVLQPRTSTSPPVPRGCADPMRRKQGASGGADLIDEGMLRRYLYRGGGGGSRRAFHPSEENNNSGRFEKRRNRDRKPKSYQRRWEWKKLLSWWLWLSPPLKINLPY